MKQVNGRCEVYVDGGIMQGTDILKALALGARMVLPFQKGYKKTDLLY